MVPFIVHHGSQVTQEVFKKLLNRRSGIFWLNPRWCIFSLNDSTRRENQYGSVVAPHDNPRSTAG